MGKQIPEVDAYIEHKAADFAKPLLKQIRALFHKACPKAEECIKWGVPHWEYHGILGGMAAFKKHVTIGLWRGKEIDDPHGLFEGVASTQMSGIKITGKDDFPPKAHIVQAIKAAAALNQKLNTDPEAKAAAARKKATNTRARQPVRAPADLTAALKKNKQAAATYKAFPPSHKREYVEWITEAKREDTRKRRVAQAVELMAEGKDKNWKYRKC